MYNISVAATRWFDVKLPDGRVLHLEGPTLGILKRIENLDGTADDMARLAATVLSKNKKGTKISPDYVLQNMGVEQCSGLLTAYMEWVNGEKADDPN